MPLNDVDRAWIREAVREASKPSIAKFFKDWVPAAAVVALLIFAWTKNGEYSEFRGKTEQRLADIEKAQARQNLTASASLSPESFASNLPQLQADIKTAREKQVSVPPAFINDLSQRFLATDIKASGYWPAAVQFVDYKFLPRPGSDSLPNCLRGATHQLGQFEEIHNSDGSISRVPGLPFQAGHVAAEAIFTNCVLDLDDIGQWKGSAAAQSLENLKKSHPEIDRYILDLTGVLIKYSGGPLLPVSEIRFRNCWFELPAPTESPNPPTQKITTQLLEAERYNGKVDLASGA